MNPWSASTITDLLRKKDSDIKKYNVRSNFNTVKFFFLRYILFSIISISKHSQNHFRVIIRAIRSIQEKYP